MLGEVDIDAGIVRVDGSAIARFQGKDQANDSLTLSAMDLGAPGGRSAWSALPVALYSLFAWRPALRLITLDLDPQTDLAAWLCRTGLATVRKNSLGDAELCCLRSMLWQHAPLWSTGARSADYPLHYTVSDGKRHPLRPPVPSGTVYRRHVPELDVVVSLRTIDPEADIDVFHRWMNDPRVSRFWELAGDRDHHTRYLASILADPHVHPLVGLFNDEPFGYFQSLLGQRRPHRAVLRRGRLRSWYPHARRRRQVAWRPEGRGLAPFPRPLPLPRRQPHQERRRRATRGQREDDKLPAASWLLPREGIQFPAQASRDDDPAAGDLLRPDRPRRTDGRTAPMSAIASEDAETTSANRQTDIKGRDHDNGMPRRSRHWDWSLQSEPGSAPGDGVRRPLASSSGAPPLNGIQACSCQGRACRRPSSRISSRRSTRPARSASSPIWSPRGASSALPTPSSRGFDERSSPTTCAGSPISCRTWPSSTR